MKNITFLSTLLATTILAGNALADVVVSGNCGNNCSYTLDSDGLLSIYPTDETQEVSIGDNAFNNYDNWAHDAKNVNLSGNITSIGDGAFFGVQLESITIPDTVTSIGMSAFSHIYTEFSITIPNSVTSIGTEAFFETNLTSITIPDSVDYFGDYVFADTMLTEVFCSETRKNEPNCGIHDAAFIYAPNNISFGYYKDENGFRTFYNADGTLADREAEPLASKNNADSALIEKYNGTPLLYGKKIYTVQEAEDALSDGTKFHVGLTYK